MMEFEFYGRPKKVLYTFGVENPSFKSKNLKIKNNADEVIK
jgi:hypothetical protein